MTLGPRLEADQAQAARYLEGVAKRLKDAGVPTRLEVFLGEPAVEILTAAEKENVDLIAMMSHGATGLSHFDRGSVAEKVLKGATGWCMTGRCSGGRPDRGLSGQRDPTR